MAGYRLQYRELVQTEDFSRLPANITRRIVRAIEMRLIAAPDRYGMRLRKSLTGLWRMRIGDYRVVYEIEGGTVRIWMIGHRKEAYEEAARRWFRRRKDETP